MDLDNLRARAKQLTHRFRIVVSDPPPAWMRGMLGNETLGRLTLDLDDPLEREAFEAALQVLERAPAGARAPELEVVPSLRTQLMRLRARRRFR